MKLFKSLALLLLCIALAACVSLAPAAKKAPEIYVPWKTRKVDLGQIKSWSVSGAVALHLPKQALTAYLHWQQKSSGAYKLNLFGPLGMGAVVLSASATGAVVLHANGHVYQAASAEALLEEAVGWSLPVADLYYWVRGLPAPGAKDQLSWDKYGRLSQLKQQGWVVDYLSYTKVGGDSLPSELELKGRQLSAKIAISAWKL